MSNIVINKTSFLDAPLTVDSLHGVTFTNENGAHKFVISCMQSGELKTLTGSVSARFMRANNTTILLSEGYASIEDGKAVVTLHQDCYNVPGRFQLAIFNTADNSTVCIYACVGTVQRSQNGDLIDSGDVVPSIDELLAQIEACQTATTAATNAASAANAAAESASTAGESKFVRYDAAQALTASQQAQARANIGASTGAVLYSETQTLTDAEKATARGNVSAASATDVDDLKSAITGPSYNLYAGKISNALITASGVVGTSTSGNSLYYAPVEEGKIYSFRLNETTTNSHGGFFENKPEKASVTYNGGRVTFTASGNIVAPITGWFAYLETDNFTQPQINAGQILLPYPSDITAIDSTARVKIDNLDGVEEGTLNYSIATTVSDGAGKYIRHTGSVASNNSFNYTDPVDIAPEFTIKVKAAGSSNVNNVSIISKYENGVFVPLVLNYNGNSPTEYTYTAHEAEKIVISYLISASLEVKITGNVINSILNINELVKSANSSLSGSPLQMFTDIVCCGDSLTYSAVFSDATHSRQAFVPWPTQIERSYGIQTIIQAQSGMNPKTWFESYGNTIAQSSAGNRLYITYFGHNASTQYPYTDTFETDCPADTDPATWADTLTGWWGRIINDIYAAGCKALIIRVSDSNGYRATQDAIIEDIAARWNVPVIDNPYLPDTIYHSATDSYANEAHYNDLGYMAFCRQLMTNINKMSLTDLGHLLPSD